MSNLEKYVKMAKEKLEPLMPYKAPLAVGVGLLGLAGASVFFGGRLQDHVSMAQVFCGNGTNPISMVIHLPDNTYLAFPPKGEEFCSIGCSDAGRPYILCDNREHIIGLVRDFLNQSGVTLGEIPEANITLNCDYISLRP